MARKRTVLLYGRTGAGKSTQIGNLAEDVYVRTGKVTRLATADRGGTDSIRPYIDLGIIELIERGDSNPWIFWNKVVRGNTKKDGKWVIDVAANAKVGMWAFESMTSYSDDVMADMVKKAAAGINIGGTGNVSFNAEGDGETVKVSGSNMAMFGVAQSRLMEDVWESQKLPGEFVLWTAGVSKDSEETSNNKVLGPAAAGKALTAEIPRSFGYTFRQDAIPVAGGRGKEHVLYLGISLDSSAGNAVTLGNTRVPLGADLPISLKPADLVKAFKLIEEAEEKATASIKARMAAKQAVTK